MSAVRWPPSVQFDQLNNSGMKPPLPVVDPQRFYRSGEIIAAPWKIRNPNFGFKRPKIFTPPPSRGLPEVSRSAGGALTFLGAR